MAGRVKAGSVQEDDDQRGFAHFVEHMAFNGTRTFPGNTLIDVIEKTGMSFGADLNAYTSFDETVYQLTIPTDDSVVFSQGLQILDDWVTGGVLMDSMQVVGERGVILGEWRARLPDTLTARLQKDMLGRMFGKNSKYVDRFPIGLPELIENANPEPLERYYRDWYRPDNMAVIAVGDFDPGMVEREIIARFGRVVGPESPRLWSVPEVESSDKTVIHIVRDQVGSGIEFTWPIPEAETLMDFVRFSLAQSVLIPHLQRAFTKLTKQERRPFAGASIGHRRAFSRATGPQYTLAVRASPDSLLSGTRAALNEVERIAQSGISVAELESQKTAILRRYEQLADGSSVIPSRSIATIYVDHFLNGKGYLLSAEQQLAAVRQVLPQITVDDIARAAQFWRSEINRKILVGIPRWSAVATIKKEEVLSLIDSVTSTVFSDERLSINERSTNATSGSHSIISVLPKPGSILSEDISDSNKHTTTWYLSNGARVVFKETDNHPDEIIIHAFSQGGHSVLPDSLFFSPARFIPTIMSEAAGFGEKSREELRSEIEATGLKALHVNINAFNEEVIVQGSPRELEMLFQSIYAQFTSPVLDGPALEEWKRSPRVRVRQNPSDVYAYNFSGHRRLSPVQSVNVQLVDLDQALRVFQDRFGDASDFTFVIVGAASADIIKPFITQYIASLPSTNRVEREQPRDFKIKLPEKRNVKEHRVPQLQASQAHAAIRFLGDLETDSSTIDIERYRLQTISAVLSRRLRNKLREEMAVVYSASAPVLFYRSPGERYAFVINLLTSPEDMPKTLEAMWAEINALRSEGPTLEELQIAATIQRRRGENSRQSNAWVVNRILHNEMYDLPVHTGFEIYAPELTPADFQAALERYISKDIYIQQVVLPTKEKIEEAKKVRGGVSKLEVSKYAERSFGQGESRNTLLY